MWARHCATAQRRSHFLSQMACAVTARWNANTKIWSRTRKIQTYCLWRSSNDAVSVYLESQISQLSHCVKPRVRWTCMERNLAICVSLFIFLWPSSICPWLYVAVIRGIRFVGAWIAHSSALQWSWTTGSPSSVEPNSAEVWTTTRDPNATQKQWHVTTSKTTLWETLVYPEQDSELLKCHTRLM